MKSRFSLFLGLVLIIMVIGSQTAFAQGGLLWTGSFYNNQFLIGPSVENRTFSSINFNWGTDRPYSSVNADNFSARFSTAGEFAAGTYRFTITADDGVHLIIDNNNVVIDTFDAPRPGETLTVDVPLSAGTHHLQVDYRGVSGGAYVNLNWVNLGNVPAQPQPVSGAWTVQYYNNTNLSGAPVSTFTEYSPTHNWGYGSPLGNLSADNFSARWTSTQFLNQGTYEFTVRAANRGRSFAPTREARSLLGCVHLFFVSLVFLSAHPPPSPAALAVLLSFSPVAVGLEIPCQQNSASPAE